MAALTRASLGGAARVRAAIPGEGFAIAALWRELWDAHQEWGGYPGSSDEAVYAQLAGRLDDDARVRGGRPLLGSHVHLIADCGGAPCGQVEGWLERHGLGVAAPLTCEVRSLVVATRARGLGLGRALLDALAETARAVAPNVRCVLAAEVLEPNPAHAFYARTGFAPVAWSARLDPTVGSEARQGSYVARAAASADAPAVARLETVLSARRRERGDIRFDPPRPFDTTLLAVIAAHLASEAREQGDSGTLVVVDKTGAVRGAASVIVQTLEPPFLPVRRSLVGRFALDPACPTAALVGPLVTAGCRFAAARGAARVELTDLSAPGSALFDAALALGATPWSRVVTREVPVPCPP
jgi:GNAT superfamily N-acetyltransferase